jgi:acyl-CoA synthetase (AMP-forming)/AMP-acid ligase II
MHVADPVPTTLIGLTNSISSERTALIQPEQHIRLSYGELRTQVQVLAENLAALGVKRGDRIGIALPNGIPSILCFLAASEVGTAAPLNPAYKEEEFRFYLEDTNARVLLLPPDGAEEARRAAGNSVQVVTVDMDASGTVTFSCGKAGRVPVSPASLDDTALVLHTSGSTGRPKRVPLSHANLSVSAQNVARTYTLTGDDVTMCVMPLFHVHGLVASTLATLATGGTIVVPTKFNPLSFWRVARAHGITWYSAVPTIHQLLLARTGSGGRPEGAEKLRFIRSCSAALPPQVMQDLETAFGAPVLEAYGMTEAAHQMTSNPLPPGKRHAGSVGQGTGVRVSIMDSEGRHLAAGERGEVVIKGPNVVKGYENNPEANATSFVDGWFRTGDQGFLDEDGYLRLVARIKELIIRGGEKISPREIDEILLTHPAVAEAVCFGVPHKTWGEEVAAAVVLREPATEADLLAFCREHLAEFRRPKHIYITDAIPRTATGKIQRRVVAQAFSKAS